MPLSAIAFDITTTPCSTERLIQVRDDATRALRGAAQHERWHSAITLGYMVLLALIYSDVYAHLGELTPWQVWLSTLSVSALLLMSGRGDPRIGIPAQMITYAALLALWVGSFPDTASVDGIVLAAAALLVASWLLRGLVGMTAFGLTLILGVGAWLQNSGISCGVAVSLFLTSALLAIIFGLLSLEQSLFSPQCALKTLDITRELNSSALPDECIEFASLVDTDEDVRSYHQALLRMGRRPVFGEFHAARLWASMRGDRMDSLAKVEKAKEACQRMALVTAE